MKNVLLILFLLAVPVLSKKKQKPLLKNFMGLNGHYQFKPELYKENCRLVRNYHNFNWDVKKPGDKPTFPTCVNKVNWDRVYGPWKNHGFEIDICAMFGTFSESNKNYMQLWKGKEKWAYQYGFEMAKHFGSRGKSLATSIEIGNEPGNDFNDELYKKIFLNMAKGIRAADPKMKIVTGTAQAREADKYSKSMDETFSSTEIKGLYDVINLHVYAMDVKKKGQSPWHRSYPEDPKIEYLKVVDEAIAWRNKHTPGKEIWITEFGWDSCTPAAMKKRDGWFKKLNWQGVSDLQQAQYLVRSVFTFAERDIDRAYMYFFNDSDKASVHASSGLTRNFNPKKSYWAVSHLYKTLGEYRYKRTLKKSRELNAQEYVHGQTGKKVWVLWKSTGSQKEITVTLPSKPAKIEQMPTSEHKGINVKWTGAGKTVKVPVSESPIYIFLN